jgi:hypothetical protein
MSSPRELTSSFLKMRVRWVSTVLTLMKSWAAI